MSAEAGSLTLVFGHADERPELEPLLRSGVFRVGHYRATPQAAIGSAPLSGPDLLVLESTADSPPDGASATLRDPVSLAARAAVAPDPASPTGGAHSALLVVIVGNTADDRDADFHRWYDESHVPEILATGTYHAGARLTLAPDATAATGASTLALYATGWDDPDAALAELFANNPRMTLWPSNDARHVRSYALVGQAER